MRLRLAPDGTTALMEGPGEPDADDISGVVAVMPAAFPRGLVKVGQSWTREMPLPSHEGLGGRSTGTRRTVVIPARHKCASACALASSAAERTNEARGTSWRCAR